MDFATDNYILRPILVEGLMFFNISFRFDVCGLIFVLIVFIVSDYILLYSAKTASSVYIYSINFLVVLGSIGTFLAANLFTFTIFMETTSIGIFIYILQSQYTNKTKSAYIYLIYSLGSGVFLIAAVCLFSTQRYGGDFYLFQLVGPNLATNISTVMAVLAFFIKLPSAPFYH
jgi:formate hydrogenlyase subunit 3/multisubunit Na+/H+ antiporter MnhD subunit